MNRRDYKPKEICKVCPISSCRGSLKLIKKQSKDYNKHTCEKCGRTMILDTKGCGIYD